MAKIKNAQAKKAAVQHIYDGIKMLERASKGPLEAVAVLTYIISCVFKRMEVPPEIRETVAHLLVSIETNCPTCKAKLNAARDVNGVPVEVMPGYISLCSGCGEFLKHQEDLQVRLLSDEEFAALPDEVKQKMRNRSYAVRKLKQTCLNS